MVKLSRRIFLYILGLLTIVIVNFGLRRFAGVINNNLLQGHHDVAMKENKTNPGMESDRNSYVFLSRNGTPENNTQKVIDMMGGIEKLIDPDDIVVLKPNGQWWNQGMTNTNSMKAFIELVLGLPNFTGEIIIAENHHFPDDNSRGWTTGEKNGDFNYNELIDYFQAKGHKNVTKYHWHDGGPSKPGAWGGAENGGIVNGPAEGDGYVWEKEFTYHAPNGKKVMMSYPIFTSQYSGIKIDFLKGPWKDGKYLERKLKFINFSSLNTHGGDTGVTASIKNYLGICDMTCGYRGIGPKGFYNFHYVGPSKIPRRIKKVLRIIGWKDHYDSIGGCVGFFMKNIRLADLNIITAEWSGFGSRTDTSLRANTKTILASRDPVALDYVAAKEVLLPVTQDREYKIYHNPDLPYSPFRKFLISCHREGIGNLKPEKIKIQKFSFSSTT